MQSKISEAGNCFLPLISVFHQIIHFLYTVFLHTDSVSPMNILSEQAEGIFGYKILSSREPEG